MYRTSFFVRFVLVLVLIAVLAVGGIVMFIRMVWFLGVALLIFLGGMAGLAILLTQIFGGDGRVTLLESCWTAGWLYLFRSW